MSHTEEQYNGLQAAYDHFNDALFERKLPNCLITLQRHKGAYGYFSSGRFQAGDRNVDEIALNPKHFLYRTTEEVLGTLVHEMVHLWQHHFGNAPKTAYHNKEWAEQMKQMGLYPSTTGQPGGKETGQSCSHYIMEFGAFADATRRFVLDRDFILFGDTRHDEEKAKKKAASKTKYTCPDCDSNAWAKPDSNIICGDCNVKMENENEI